MKGGGLGEVCWLHLALLVVNYKFRMMTRYSKLEPSRCVLSRVGLGCMMGCRKQGQGPLWGSEVPHWGLSIIFLREDVFDAVFS